MQYFAECDHCRKFFPVYREDLPLVPEERDCIQVSWIACPFESEINDDDTKMWLCDTCANDCAMEI